MITFILVFIAVFMICGGGFFAAIKALMKGVVFLILLLVALIAGIVMYATSAVTRGAEGVHGEVSSWSLSGVGTGWFALLGATLLGIAAAFLILKDILTPADPGLLHRLRGRAAVLEARQSSLTPQEEAELLELRIDIEELQRGNRPQYHFE